MSPSNQRFVSQRGRFVLQNEPDKLLEHFSFVLHSGSVRGAQEKRHSGFRLESCHKHPLTLADTELRLDHGLLK